MVQTILYIKKPYRNHTFQHSIRFFEINYYITCLSSVNILKMLIFK